MWNKKILALGADIKNRFLFSKNGRLYFGPDIGDLSQADNFDLFKRHLHKALKKAKPDIVACDLHPNYFSSVFAKEINCRLKRIQHHHAHIASVMQEHKLKGPVIGVSFDGSGFGQDGNSWGGEFLLVDKKGFKRMAHLKYRMMPGGDKVVSEPWRMTLSILGKDAFSFLPKVRQEDKDMVLTMLKKNINSPLTSSAGRLFDAAAALLGICVYASYEAEGPIKLEAICDSSINDCYDFNTDSIFCGMLKDLKKGKAKHFIATKFHNSMAGIIVKTVKKISKSSGIKKVALSGGVFQNRFLKQKAIKQLRDLNFKIYTNIETPVNDLNISLGQYYVSGHAGKS